jgi:hypothetical protein
MPPRGVPRRRMGRCTRLGARAPSLPIPANQRPPSLPGGIRELPCPGRLACPKDHIGRSMRTWPPYILAFSFAVPIHGRKDLPTKSPRVPDLARCSRIIPSREKMHSNSLSHGVSVFFPFSPAGEGPFHLGRLRGSRMPAGDRGASRQSLCSALHPMRGQSGTATGAHVSKHPAPGWFYPNFPNRTQTTQSSQTHPNFTQTVWVV